MSVLGTATAFAIHPFQSFVLKFRKFSTRWSRERSVRTGRKSSFIDRLSQGPTFHCVRVRFRVSLNALGCNLIAFLTSLLGERVVIQSAFAAICTRFRVSNHTQLHEQVRSANSPFRSYPMEESRLDTAHTAEMIGAVAKDLGREVKVYISPAAMQSDEPTGSSQRPEDDLPDDYYDFTAADYAAIQASKPKEEIHLKTKKIREREEAAAAKRAQRMKATVRVHFPDGFVVEAAFKSTETISDVMELVRRAITRPDMPFHLYTTPPKKPLRDLQQNMIDASFCPGANVHFSYNPSQAVEIPREGPFLRPEVQELRDLHKLQEEPSDSGLRTLQDPIELSPPPPEAPAKRTASERKIPKWMQKR